MKSTLDLLERAKSSLGPTSERALSLRLGHAATTLTTARQRGSLSPELAGQLADTLGMPPAEVAQWMALAYIESKPKTAATTRLHRLLHTVTLARNSYFAILTRLSEKYAHQVRTAHHAASLRTSSRYS